MTDQLETDLRRSLAGAAAEVPTQTIGARLRSQDYRARPPHLRPLVALGGAASLAIAVGIAISVIGLSAGTPSAFAGWSATPTTPASGQVSAAEAACAKQEPYPGEPGYAGLTPTVVDARGPFTLLVYVDGTSHEECVVAPSGAASQSTMRGAEVALAPGAIRWRSAGSGAELEGHAYSEVTGEVGAGVTAATLVLEDGTRVQTTIANSWFAAWWPGTGGATAAEVTTASGTTTEPLPQLGPRAHLDRVLGHERGLPLVPASPNARKQKARRVRRRVSSG